MNNYSKKQRQNLKQFSPLPKKAKIPAYQPWAGGAEGGFECGKVAKSSCQAGNCFTQKS